MTQVNERAARRRRPNPKQTVQRVGDTSSRILAAPTDTTADLDDTARCKRCNRPLRTELAVAAGLGPICAMAAIARVPLHVSGIDVDQLALPLDEAVADE
jgi:hypothetical protein